VVRLTSRAREELRSGEALVFDWHRVAICCASAGEVSLRCAPVERLELSRSYRRVATEPTAPVFIHRGALPHLAGRDVAVDCRRLLGLRRFVSDLPPDFGLRASLGRLPEEGTS
jgi:hypothetical protein